MVLPRDHPFREGLIQSDDLGNDEDEQRGRYEGLRISLMQCHDDRLTHNNFLAEPLVRSAHERLENKYSHQHDPQRNSTRSNHRHRQGQFQIPRGMRPLLDRIDHISTHRPLVEPRLGNVLRSQSTDSYGLGACRAPPNGELAFPDPPRCNEDGRVEREEEGVEGRIRVGGCEEVETERDE